MTVIPISKALIIGSVTLVLVALALPFVLAAGEWVWDSWRERGG
jgi:hypothetical protein